MFFRFIYVNYNAWHYTGCDTLWAGIIIALAEKIEQEFGVFTTRVFRSLSLDVIERPVSKSVQYFLIESKKDDSTEDIKEEFPTAIELKKWLDKNDYTINNLTKTNEKKYWVAEFEFEKKVKEAYEKSQNCKKRTISMIEILDCSSKKKKNCENKHGFCEHFKNFLKVGYVLSLLEIAFVFFTSASLFTYDLYRDFKNISSKSVSLKNIYN